MTDKMMSDQVYILISDVPIYEPGMITVYDSADLGSDPDGVKILIPWRFWDVLGYIDTHLG